MHDTKVDPAAKEPSLSLAAFISTNRDEVIRRCQEAFLARAGSPLEYETNADGVPLFLNQMVDELVPGRSSTESVRQGASTHGRNLFLQGFTVDQVVHSFGDVCQAVTGLAAEQEALITAADFRTFNASLDNAIAAAVSKYAELERGIRNEVEVDEVLDLQNLVYTALTAFQAIQSGTVGVSGATGVLVERSLLQLRANVLKRKAALNTD